MREDKILWKARSIQKLKKDNFWVLVNKDIILKTKQDSQDEQTKRKIGRGLNVFPWDRAVSSGVPNAIQWWMRADEVYGWFIHNRSCPRDQQWRACYQMIGGPRCNTVHRILEFIWYNGNPLEDEDYKCWKSTQTTNNLSLTSLRGTD